MCINSFGLVWGETEFVRWANKQADGKFIKLSVGVWIMQLKLD
jgi:hypothetical protein